MRAILILSLALAATAAHAAPKQVGELAMPKRYTKATIDFQCGSKTFTLSTGNKRGSCASGVTVAECSDGKGNSAKVYCDKGCSASGAGSCTTK